MQTTIERQSASQAHLWKLAENEYAAQANNVLIGTVTGNVKAIFPDKSRAEKFLTDMGFEAYKYAELMDWRTNFIHKPTFVYGIGFLGKEAKWR